MKVAISRRFGGFGISVKALMLLIKRKAKCVEKCTVQHYYGGTEEYKDKPAYDSNWQDKFNKDFKDAKALEKGFFVYGICETITDKEFIYSFDGYDYIQRKDKDLIKVVEELGKEANGSHAELTIVKIPDGVDYHIDEYDGLESIHETHRSWI